MVIAITSIFTGFSFVYADAASNAASNTVGVTGEEDMDGYLFAYFTGESEAIRLALSVDGYNFTPLNSNNTIVQHLLGTTGARDPYIIRGNDGYVYLIATDLKVSTAGTPWGKNSSIVTWRSKDLVNWEEETVIKIRGEYESTSYENQYKIWAPEAVYDKERGEYMLFWSMEGGASGNDLMLWYAYTKDFKTLTTEPQVLYNPGTNTGGLNLTPVGSNTDCIDGNIIENNGTYYLYYKYGAGSTAGVQMASSTNITGPYLPCDEANPNKLVSPAYVEGSDVFKLIDQDKWVMIYDFNWDKHYGASESTDLLNWKTLADSDVSLNFGGADTSKNPKHGYVIPITATEYDALYSKYGVEEPAATAPPETETYPDSPVGSHESAVLTYDFETVTGTTVNDTAGVGAYNALLQGAGCSVASTQVGDTQSNALYLNGSSSYLEFPRGFFDGKSTMSISMDIKSSMNAENFFTFAIGDSTITPGSTAGKYLFYRSRATSQYVGITNTGYGTEQGLTGATSSINGVWTNIKIVVKPDKIKLYQDGKLIASNVATTKTITDLGTNLSAYLGRSFYSADKYFTGYYDNVNVYDRALTLQEIQKEFGIIEDKTQTVKAVKSTGMNIIKSEIDNTNHKVKLYIGKNNSVRTNMQRAQLDFTLYSGSTMSPANKTLFNLETGANFKITTEGVTTDWTVEGVQCNNPILGGLYADPDIDIFNGKYYIYPTTDGFTGWNTQKFHVFSSEDMVNWIDEGVILDLSAGDVAWADTTNCYAWAPTIERKNGKYYFYFCGRDKSTNKQAMGVAVADSPTGPFVAEAEPIMTVAQCTAAGGALSQTIDPSIFTDEDTGESYMLFGNGGNGYNIVKLNEDMISWEPETLYHYPNGTFSNFREAITVFKKDGIYHFTWSCNDTGQDTYCINYAVADKLYAETVTNKGTILYKVPEDDILGTGHHSIVKNPGTYGEYYIAYARFGTPLADYAAGTKGYNRETCMELLEFDDQGYIKKITPTLEGIQQPRYANVILEYKAGAGGMVTGGTKQYVAYNQKATTVTAIPEEGKEFVKWSDGVTTAVRDDENVTADATITAIFQDISTEPTEEPTAEPTTGPTTGPTTVPTTSPTTSPTTIPTQAPTITPTPMPVKPGTVTKVTVNKNTPSSVTLSWNKVSNAEGYLIERYDTTKKEWITVKPIASSTTSNSKITGLSAGSVYSFRIKAYVLSGTTKVTGDSSKVMITATTPKKAFISTKKLSKSKVKLTWSKGTRADGYIIQMKIGNGSYKDIKTISSAKKYTYTKTGLKSSKKYSFRICGYKKVNSQKIRGTYSNVKTFK